MNAYRPLSDRPEFSVLEYPGYREYRIENPKHSSRGTSALPEWIIAFGLPTILAVFWKTPSRLFYVFLFICLTFFLKQRLLGVLHESVVILPPHGIQLETHRGFSNQWPLLNTKRFIPSASLADVVINEGIRGWNVLYYLVAVKSDPSEGSSLEVAYEDLLPCHAILLQVYEGIHEILLSRSISCSSLKVTSPNNCNEYDR